MNTVQMLKALGDDTRIRIVNILRDGPLCVCEIESILEITQSNASRHLSKLMNANIVTYYKEAKYVYYKLDEETLNKYSFIKVLLDNELDEDEELKSECILGYIDWYNYVNNGFVSLECNCGNSDYVLVETEPHGLKGMYT